MKGLWAVYQYEIRQWWMVLPGALVLVLLAVVGTGQDFWKAFSLIAVTAAALLLAPALGARVLQEDLLSGRLSFFSRLPLTLAAFWWGKVLAALTMLIGAAGLVVVVMGVIGDPWLPSAPYLPLLIAQMLTFFALGHAWSLGIQRPSLWSRLNSAGFFVLLLVLVASWNSFLEFGRGTNWSLETGSFVWWGLVVEMIFVGVVAIASWVQVLRGQSLPERGQRAFVMTLWGIFLPVLGVIGLYVLTAPPPAPEHVEEFRRVLSAPSGDLVFVTGYSSRRNAEDSFFVNMSTGNFFHIEQTIDSAPAFSEDGRRAAWLDVAGELRFVDFVKGSSPKEAFQVLPTRIHTSASILDIALSPKGRSVVVSGLYEVRAYDVATARVLADHSLPGKMIGIRFPEPNLVRFYLASIERPQRNPMSIYELSLETGELRRSGTLEGFAWPGQMVVNAEGSQVLRVGALGCGDTTEAEAAGGDYYQKAVVDICLYDGTTGAPLADLGDFPEVPLRWARFLADGRLAVLSRERLADAEEGQGTLHIFSPEGTAQQQVDLGRANSFQVGTQPDAGSLWISTQPGSRLLRVDLDTGTVRQEDGELSALPLGSGGRQRESRFRYLPEPVVPLPGETGARLLLSGEGELVLQQKEGQGLRQISLHSIPYTLAPWLQPPAGGPTLSNG
ncbi:MAG: hypothetical protein SX243_10650 [Acidobacteriota bacterium]|nr:hypothetical protein [Acidobacteriota bacterium]